MSRSFSAALSLIFPAASAAFAGTVTFDPPHVEVVAGETVSMIVTVDQTDLGEFDSVGLLIVGPVEWPGIDFVYDLGFLDHIGWPDPGTPDCKWFCYGIVVGGSDFSGPIFKAPVVVGTVIFDTTSLTEGNYDIVVSAAGEEKLFGFALSVAAAGFTQEGLEGRATFTVIPEPSTLLLFVIGVLSAGHHFHRSCKGVTT